MRFDVTSVLDKYYLDRYVNLGDNHISTTTCNQYSKSVLIRRWWDANARFAYALGLWVGDKYVYGNRIGLSNKNNTLLKIFQEFLENVSKPAKIRHVIEYGVKTKVYINSALLRRILESLQNNTEQIIKSNLLIPYIAGKIDSDGTIMPYNLRHNSGLAKITYGSLLEAKIDLELLASLGYRCSLIKYKDRNAFDLKLSILSCLKIFPKLLKHIRHQEKKNKILFCIEAAKTRKLVP